MLANLTWRLCAESGFLGYQAHPAARKQTMAYLKKA
jgi:hypothetical protein